MEKEIIKRFKKYVSTYPEYDYEGYSIRIFILDMFYGLGIALKPEEYRFAIGFQKFLGWLDKFLEDN